MEALMQKKPISLRLTEEALEDMKLIAEHLFDGGNDAAMWGGEANKTYAVIYALREVAESIRKGDKKKFTKS